MTPELQELKTRLDRAERRARLSWACALAALALTVLLNVRPAVLAQSPGVSLASLLTRIQVLEQKTQFQSADSAAKTTTFTACNVQILDGSPYGLTDDGTGGEHAGATLTGLGNLIIGYNALRNNPSRPDARTGSHNLILGDENNYTAYGSIVVGEYNTADSPYASVTGGADNTASGEWSSVSGGYANTASGPFAAISGGFSNTASGGNASISGGANLTQSTDDGWTAGSKGSAAYAGNFTSP
jgi:hypothetical protein